MTEPAPPPHGLPSDGWSPWVDTVINLVTAPALGLALLGVVLDSATLQAVGIGVVVVLVGCLQYDETARRRAADHAATIPSGESTPGVGS